MIMKMLTHIHMVVYTRWCWHICKGEEVEVDVDQLGEKIEVKCDALCVQYLGARVRNFIGGVSTRRVQIVRRCHRCPVQKRQGFTECTRRWSCSDRTLESCVRSVARSEGRPRSLDRTQATGLWLNTVQRLVVLMWRRTE